MVDLTERCSRVTKMSFFTSVTNDAYITCAQMKSANFMQWFEKLFLPAVNILKPELHWCSFFDGELAKENNAHLLCLTPRSTALSSHVT